MNTKLILTIEKEVITSDMLICQVLGFILLSNQIFLK